MDTVDSINDKVGSASKGIKFASKGYKISLPTKGANVVNVINKNAGRVVKGVHKGEWILRFDRPHKGVNFNHININEAVSGIRDPHIKISPGTLKGAEKCAKFAKSANKVLLPAAIAIDVGRCGYAIYEDVKTGTSRNTVETAASVAGGWGGGYGGCVGGAAIGSMIFPGIGTIVGGVIGGVIGGIGGSFAAEEIVSEIADACDYETEDCVCKNCKVRYRRHKHKKNESSVYCRKCR